MESEMSEYAAESQADRDLEEKDIFENMTPAEHFEAIRDLAKGIEAAVKDLQELLAKPAFTFDEKGKMIF